MTTIHRRLTRALCAGLAGVLVAGIGVPPAAAHDPAALPDPGPLPQTAVGGDIRLTLVTGDIVSVNELGGGRSVQITPGEGRSNVVFYKQEERGDLSVLPSDAVGLVLAGTVDARLFNVSALIRDHLDDAHRDTLPLIVGHTGNREPAALARADGKAGERALTSIGATAVRQRRDQAAGFWADIVREASAGAVASLEAGLGKVWLDARYKTQDDVGNAQIGVPAAREAGYTGGGTTVAVLDSGWDHDHPDLQGTVVTERNFVAGSDDADADDDNGHGTHVAGIIAGSGAASGGRYAGVAPDADLLVGKVIDGDGSGFSSDIIAGMEWAVAQGADIVNMSLGSSTPSAGTDLLSQAVNTLSAQSDTLFVVAGGNSGPGGTTIGAPAAADSALTVGAVDSASVIAPFSSRGPRLGDGAVKPDITAPGVAVIAPRAKGTPVGDVDPDGPIGPVDDNYTALSGTSMATPAVAGAAALLAQGHPGWDGERLKAALTATASPQPKQSVYAQGSGLTDLARAIRQPVTAAPTSLVVGQIRWPYAPVTRTVTYRNDGTAPVTLRMSPALSAPDGATAPDGLLRLSATEVTVPAQGTSTVDVTITAPADVPPAGAGYAWRLVAISADGATRVQTTVGVHFEAESYDFTFTAADRNGSTPLSPYLATIMIKPIDRAGASSFALVNAFQPEAKLRLPKGNYGITALIDTVDPVTGMPTDLTLESRPRVTLRRATSVFFDARKGKPVAVGVADKTVAPWFREFGGLHTSIDSAGAQETAGFGVFDPYYSTTPLSAVPTPARRRDSTYRYFYRTTMAAPAAPEALIPGPVYALLERERGGVPARLTYDVPTRRLAKVDAYYGKRTGQLDGAARVILGLLPGQSSALNVVRNVPIPSHRVEYYSAGPDASWTNTLGTYKTPDGGAWYSLGHQRSDPRTYRPGQAGREMWNYPTAGPSLPANGQFLTRTADRITPAFSLWGDSDPRHNIWNDRAFSTASARLYRDGELVGELNQPWPDELDFDNFTNFWTVPAGQANYRLDVTASRNLLWHGQRSRNIAASWTFRSGHTDTTTSVPLTVVRFQPPTNEYGVAPAGARFTVPFVVQQQGIRKPGARRLTVEASYDEGATWTRVPVTLRGTNGMAKLTHPAGAGWVSLRARGTDAAGNTVNQTITWAYQIG